MSHPRTLQIVRRSLPWRTDCMFVAIGAMLVPDTRPPRYCALRAAKTDFGSLENWDSTANILLNSELSLCDRSKHCLTKFRTPDSVDGPTASVLKAACSCWVMGFRSRSLAAQ